MKKLFLLAVVFMMAAQTILTAQTDDEKKRAADAKKRMEEVQASTKKEAKEGWAGGGGIGLDLSALNLFQPRVGAGQNRIGVGGLASIFFNYKKDNLVWDNVGGLQLAVQKIGGNSNPYQKSLDVIRFDSKVGYKIYENLFGSVLGSFLTQLTPTYDAGTKPGELGAVLSPFGASGTIPVSKFMSPAIIEISPGLDYKYDSHLSVFWSPVSLKYIIVSDQQIADRSKGAFGTDATATGYKTSRLFLGMMFRGAYTNKFWDDRIAYTGSLKLFSDCLSHKSGNEVIGFN